jgi:hypothetical protein
MRKKTGKMLATFYGVAVKSAYYHCDGNWYWNLETFPGAFFDAQGLVVVQTESDNRECAYLTIGPRNTGVRDKNAGISGIPGYLRLDLPPISL